MIKSPRKRLVWWAAPAVVGVGLAVALLALLGWFLQQLPLGAQLLFVAAVVCAAVVRAAVNLLDDLFDR